MSELTWEKRTATRMNINAIKEAVTQLLELLPDDQQVFGSECQQIDSMASDLYYKYVAKYDWRPGQDGEV